MKHWVASAITTAMVLGGCAGGQSSRGPGAASAGDVEQESGVPNSRVHKTGSNEVTATIGPPGGTLELSNGPRVDIPPGAVQGSQTFVLQHGTCRFGRDPAAPRPSSGAG